MREILSFLEKQHEYHTPDEIKKGLDVLNIKIPSKKVILVTGTNGKGTTCATLQTLLIASGKNVGFFSSPHIVKINERIKHNGVDISDEDFCRIFRIIHEKVADFHFSFFEYLTLIAAYYFYFERQIDFAIFEIGLGGTLDATNAIDHDISIITRLGIEHEDVLGKGLISIAENKLGIVRKNNAVFHTRFPKDISAVYSKCLLEKNARFFEAPKLDYFIQKNIYPEYFVKINDRNYKLNLLGERAVENTSLSVEIFKYLVPNYEKYLSALQDVNWPCRMEKIQYNNRDIFLSGDHNPQGIQSLLEILKYFDFKNVHFVIGTCFDKDSDEMVRILNSVKNSHVYLTETPVKTLSIENYSEFAKSTSEYSSKNPLETLDHATKKSTNDDLILVTGSLYLTGLIKKHLYDIQHY
jgi:dihydrofolate synthase/folylpolyglutamate synthase